MISKDDMMAIMSFWRWATPQDIPLYISEKGNINVSYNDGMTPLHFVASLNRNPDMIASLVQLGLKVEQTDNGGLAAIHWAAWLNQNPDVIKALVQHKADVNMKAASITPLYMAEEWNLNPKIIQALKDAGAKR